MEVLDSGDPTIDKTLSETSEDETMPEEKENTDRGFEDAANLMLTLCQQNETEKHEKSLEIQRHIETETRRAIWYIVEEIYRGWRVSPSPETMGAWAQAVNSGMRMRKMGTAPPIIRIEYKEIIQHVLTQEVRACEW